MENEQQQTKKYWFFGSKLNTALLLLLIILMVVALKWMNEDRNKYFSNMSKDEEKWAKSENRAYENYNKDTFQQINTENFSFSVPKSVIASSTDFNNCPWFNVSIPNDGHASKGEVGIYPTSCFDLTKTGGEKEYIEKDGYYIIHHFDSAMSADEIKYSRDIYKQIINTFVFKK